MSSNSQTQPSRANRRGKKASGIVHANAPQKEQSGEPRPYLLKMLQNQIGTYILADTLDWDGEFAFSLARQIQRPPPPWRCFCRARVRNLSC